MVVRKVGDIMDVKKILDSPKAKIVLGGVLVVVLLFSMWIKVDKNPKKVAKVEEKTFAHTEPDIIKEEDVDELHFSNISLITENGYSTFTADVVNNGESESNIENVDIVFKDKDGNTVITFLGNVGSGLKPKESRTITASAKGEFRNVASKEIVKKD